MNFSIQSFGNNTNTPTEIMVRSSLDENVQNQQPYQLKYFMETINNASIKLISACPSKELLKEKLKKQGNLIVSTLAVGTLGALGYLLISYFNSQPEILEKITSSQNSQTDLSQKINQQSQTVFKETPQDSLWPSHCFNSQSMLKPWESNLQNLNSPNLNPLFFCSIKQVDMNQAKKIQLGEFMSMPELDQQPIIEKFELQDSINCFGKDFVTRFKQLPLNYQRDHRINLDDLKFDKNWGLRSNLFTAEEISLFKIESLRNLGLEEALFTKLKALPKTLVLDTNLPEEISQLSIHKFINLSGSQLTRYIDQLPLYAFFLISIDQLNDLDFSKVDLTDKQIQKIFGPQEKSNQIGFLPINTLNVIIDKIHDVNAKIDVTDEQFKQLDHTKISAKRFQQLIERSNQSPGHRLHMLTPQQLNQNLDKLKSDYFFESLSSEQIQFLDISLANKDQLRQLYGFMPEKKLDVLSEDSFKIFMNKMPDWHTYPIPAKFWHLIDFKNMNSKAFKNLIGPNSVNGKNLKKLSPDQRLAADQLLSEIGYSEGCIPGIY